MIRFIVSAVEDRGGIPTVRYLTIDSPAPELEFVLRRGGFGPDGFDVFTLVGVEELSPGVRFIIDRARSIDGYVMRSYLTLDQSNLSFREWGTVIGAEVKAENDTEERHKWEIGR